MSLSPDTTISGLKVPNNKLMHWIGSVSLGRHTNCAALGVSRSRTGNQNLDREVQQGPTVKYCIKFSVAVIVPSKKKVVIIYSPSSHSKLVWISFFCCTQIFWRTLETKQLPKADGYQLLFAYPHYSRHSFVFNRTKNEAHTATIWGWVNYDKFHFVSLKLL